ncbi:DUF4844 domain-containing protein [Niabella sp. CJ426]|uniref:DUF4844 domain-containing protein n=1 Tax=Niabella sp. CJ426 TaxID=3393740 RepID=UPI003D02DACC
MNKQNIINSLEEFSKVPKFEADEVLFYDGLADDELRLLLNNVINESANEFIDIVNMDGKGSDYLQVMTNGLKKIDEAKLLLDTTDREMVCSYYENLMDIVGLESSEGLLNTWLYGFDPNAL